MIFMRARGLSIRGRCCTVLLVGVVLSLLLAEQQRLQASLVREPRDERSGTVAVKAMMDSASGDTIPVFNARVELERFRQSSKDKNAAVDPYPAWLGCELMRRAADGRLFTKQGEVVSLHLPAQMGDASCWYVARLRTPGANPAAKAVGGPWVLWPSLGKIVEPSRDRPSVPTDTYAAQGVALGSIVVMEVYQLERSVATFSDQVKVEDDATFDEMKLLLRLQVPVVLHDDPLFEPAP